MKYCIKISEFLQTGQFGPVKLGCPKEDLIKLLGNPDGMLNLSNPSIGVHYSKYEFIFTQNKLRLIQNDQFNIDHPENMEFVNDFFQLDTSPFHSDNVNTLRNIVTKLNRLKISHSIIDYWGRKALKTEGNIIIDFNDEKWSESSNTFEKISHIKDYELIGFRYSLDQ